MSKTDWTGWRHVFPNHEMNLHKPDGLECKCVPYIICYRCRMIIHPPFDNSDFDALAKKFEEEHERKEETA